MSTPELLSLEEFFGPPVRSGAAISPDGEKIAFLAPWENRLNVWVQDLAADASTETEARCLTADDARSVLNFRWTDDPRWLLYMQDFGGDENHHVYRIDLSDPDAPAVDLTPFPGARAMGLEPARGRKGVYTVLLNARSTAELDLYEIDIASGDITMIGKSPGQGQNLMPGVDGELFVFAVTPEGNFDVSVRGKSGPARQIKLFDGADYPMGINPTQITPDGTGMWMGSTRDKDLTYLVRVDLETGEETVVDFHPTLELDGARRALEQTSSPLICDSKTGELLARMHRSTDGVAVSLVVRLRVECGRG
ncbi:hypothetical protein [Rhodococcus sp. I2R]|uniref:TolB family protein n=1 Tax=Rhodococcus sp. I2R TaxID=2855445 RepID=UPI001E36D215|nr:hypothetical protein [Rhodococcus sp. I2R]MCC8928101.1 hypothetical protein [Rhodococcus sp. I2R]